MDSTVCQSRLYRQLYPSCPKIFVFWTALSLTGTFRFPSSTAVLNVSRLLLAPEVWEVQVPRRAVGSAGDVMGIPDYEHIIRSYTIPFKRPQLGSG